MGPVAPSRKASALAKAYGIDEKITDDREQERDQRAGDDDTRVHHPLEDFVDDVLLGDVTGERVADQLDVGLDGGQFGTLLMNHRPEPVVEDRLDLGDVVLQRLDSRAGLFGRYVVISDAGGS